MHLSSPPYVPHVLPISVFLKSSLYYFILRYSGLKHQAVLRVYENISSEVSSAFSVDLNPEK
jgi:hypothetical protein